MSKPAQHATADSKYPEASPVFTSAFDRVSLLARSDTKNKFTKKEGL